MSNVKESTLPISCKPKNPANLLPYNIPLLKQSAIRIIQKNVVYSIGLSFSLSTKELLIQPQYFGQYGNISKIIINKNAYTQKKKSGITYSAYVTYENNSQAALAILGIDKCDIDGNVIRAGFGTTKYCSFFLKNTPCLNKDCLYLHSLANNEEDTFCKEESNKNLFNQHQSLAIKLCKLENIEYREMMQLKHKQMQIDNPCFPTINMIYQRFFKYNQHQYNNNNIVSNSNEDTNDDEEVEYVLVRGCNYNKRKRNNENGNEKKDRKMTDIQRGKYMTKEQSTIPLKFTRKLTYEEPIYENSKSETKENDHKEILYFNSKMIEMKGNEYKLSPSLASNTLMIQSVNITSSPEKKIKMIGKMNKSRFDFITEVNSTNTIDNNNDKVDVPESFSNFVNRKTSLLLYIHHQSSSFNDSLIKFANIETYNHIKW